MSHDACAIFHCGSTSAVGECAMAVWMRIQSFAYPFSSVVLRKQYRAQVRRACSVNVYLNNYVFIFSVEHFYSRLTLLLSALPSAERPGLQPDLTEPVKKKHPPKSKMYACAKFVSTPALVGFLTIGVVSGCRYSSCCFLSSGPVGELDSS